MQSHDSLVRYGFDPVIKPRIKTEYHKIIDEGFNALKILQDFWFERENCITLSAVESIDVNLFAIRHGLENGISVSENLKLLASELDLKNGKMKRIRNPRNVDDQTIQRLKEASNKLFVNLNYLVQNLV